MSEIGLTDKKKVALLLIIILLIFLFLLFNLFLPKISQWLAPADNKTGQFNAVPQLVEPQKNIYSVDINFKTNEKGATPVKISAVSFKLNYPPDANNPIEVVNEKGLPTSSVTPGKALLDSGDWKVPINKVTIDKNGSTVEMAAVNISTDGFTSPDFVTMARIYFKAEKPLEEDKFILTFDSDNTIILTKSKPTENIRRTNNDLFYSVQK